jgi:branched-chain amino acid transport system substrate-binding protein
MAFRLTASALVGIVAIGVWSASSAMAENVKIAFIDDLSGPFAPVSQNHFKSYQMFAGMINQQKLADGNTFEVIGFDSQGSLQQSLVQLRLAIERGIHYVVQGSSSATTLAVIDAINKNNERNPGKEVVLLNHAAIDPELTNAKCSFWHFRFDAGSDMKMEALSNFMARDERIKKVYLINQDYAYGQQVGRLARKDLTKKRPDVRIVGDDLHPLAQVKDFTPYIARIKASGADTVITGDWGTDLVLLVKAARDAGLNANFYTYYALTTGAPTAMGAGSAERVKYVGTWNVNNDTFAGQEIVEAFKKKYNSDFYLLSIYTGINMLAKAMAETKSTDPVKVAYALEGMKFRSFNGDVEMRKADHQLLQPLYIATWTKVNGRSVKYDQENTGYGWRTDAKIDTYRATVPTSCQMKRPAR